MCIRDSFFGALSALWPVMAKARRKKAAGDADAQAYIHKYVRMWAGTLLRIAGVTVTVRGADNIPQEMCIRDRYCPVCKKVFLARRHPDSGDSIPPVEPEGPWG